MEPKYVDTKGGLAAMWGGFALLFGTAFSLLMGDSVTGSLLYGAAMGLGFGIAVFLFFKPGE